MYKSNNCKERLVFLCFLAGISHAAVAAGPGLPVLRTSTSNISQRDLFYGAGGKQHEPRGAFTFVEEDLSGTNPKIVIKDQNGVKWTAKPGREARPETAASRLVWAVGYFANEDYFVHDLIVDNLPAHLHRGEKLIARNMHDARLKRHPEGEKKIGSWEWRNGPFTGTRELNGLRVLMALMNNWDLTDENTAIYEEKSSERPRRIYMVGDLGATFGAGRLTWPQSKAQGDLEAYRSSQFITRMTPDTVDFHAPAPDQLFFLATPREYFQKLLLGWIGKQVPRADARWMGELLGQLSLNQIRDAFRAAGYSSEEVEGFSVVVEERIQCLRRL